MQSPQTLYGAVAIQKSFYVLSCFYIFYFIIKNYYIVTKHFVIEKNVSSNFFRNIDTKELKSAIIKQEILLPAVVF